MEWKTILVIWAVLSVLFGIAFGFLMEDRGGDQ